MLTNLFTFLAGNDDRQKVKATLENGALLIDVRSPSEFQSGSIPNAENVPLDQLGAFIGSIKNRQKEIVLFCQSGMRSKQAKHLLKANGFDNVFNAGSLTQIRKLI